MIYDAHGVMWVRPVEIGFRREMRRRCDEDVVITGISATGTLPKWTDEERSGDPVAARKRK